ncbi:MAG TPA: hypothetical protein DEB24_06305 [Coriobacteriia bacterium]|nr:hypothetical protein [Coriobacteriia bacterium]
MIAFWLPEPDVKSASEAKKSGKKVMTPAAWILIAFFFIFNFFQFSMFTNMSLVIRAAELGTTALSGTVMSSITIATAAGAIAYGAFIKGRLGGFDLGIAVLGEAVGFFILCNWITVTGYYVGAIVWGFFFGILNPALILQCVKLVPKEGATRALSILAAMQNLGQYLSAYVLAFLAGIFGVAGTAGTLAFQLSGWVVSAPACVICGVALLAVFGILRARNPEIVAGLPEKKQPEMIEEKKEDEAS